MKPIEYSIEGVLGGSKRYIVPAYQRPYTWKDEHVKQLIDDINDSRHSGMKDYFIGSLICIEKDKEVFEVVDGQQRLITLTLIFRQLAEYLEGGAHHDLKNLYIREDHLAHDVTAAPVVEVRETEQIVYSSILEKGAHEGKMSQAEKVFASNAKNIKKYLDHILGEDDRERRVKDLAGYICRAVNVIFLKVDDDGNAFRLFHVLNSRGTPLNDADLLKSKLLESARHDPIGSKKIENAWREMEECVGGKDLNAFLLINKISEKKDRNRVSKQNYQYYATKLGSQYGDDSVSMAIDLLKSAKNHRDLMTPDRNVGVRRVIAHLLRLKSHKEWLPAFLAFFNKCDAGKCSMGDFPQMACLFEKVYMQCCVFQGVRDSLCYYAIEAINAENGSFDDVMAVIKGQADSERFEDALDSTLLYDGKRPKIITLMKCVLLRLEDEWRDNSVVKAYDLKDITVEHVMPQRRDDKYWRERFTDEQHEAWLHKLGNLTLLPRGKNSAARDHDFNRKKVAYREGNKESGFELTKEVCEAEQWDMKTIKERHSRLKRKLVVLWSVESPPVKSPQKGLLGDT